MRSINLKTKFGVVHFDVTDDYKDTPEQRAALIACVEKEIEKDKVRYV